MPLLLTPHPFAPFTFAEKPLLRVKCGDVGTTAEVVEKSYSHCFTSEKSGTVVCLPVQNRIPKCKYFKVVLLDEADVFLDMKDLNRNALVSVFLRELEYDDGILILTSNHVNLGLSQRRNIWCNFINRVKSLDSAIDFEDIIDPLYDLSKIEMNGPLSYTHLAHVLQVNRKFGKYLGDPRDGVIEDEVKRESAIRVCDGGKTTPLVHLGG
ncbi:hypothetical protein F4825DRAFT_467417 [Nemania diffusa]|nr:hypothetical protein F4825DRAFT_467417 [Nemania diffusa]